MDTKILSDTANYLVSPNKGILAADESTPTIKKRFDAIGLESTEETRQSYRNLLFTTGGIEDFISGVIMYDETLRQSSSDGKAFPKLLAEKGIVPGIKVDIGAKDLANFPGEKITEGLDGLRDRLAEYKSLDAKFAKWRAVITIGDGIPTDTCVNANCEALARYATLCQEVDIVPIVEPEVLMDGNHDLKRCEEVTYTTLKRLFAKLTEYKVYLEGLLLKTNMVLSGKESGNQVSDEEVSAATYRAFDEAVPDLVPGIVFLSGGQSADDATRRLNEIAKRPEKPWELSFSFGRALQEDAINTWQGKDENFEAAQKAFYERARKVSLARQGKLEEA